MAAPSTHDAAPTAPRLRLFAPTGRGWLVAGVAVGAGLCGRWTSLFSATALAIALAVLLGSAVLWVALATWAVRKRHVGVVRYNEPAHLVSQHPARLIASVQLGSAGHTPVISWCGRWLVAASTVVAADSYRAPEGTSRQRSRRRRPPRTHPDEPVLAVRTGPDTWGYTFELTPARRGVIQRGPARLLVMDPLGLVVARLRHPSSAPVAVWPLPRPLHAEHPGVRLRVSADAHRRGTPALPAPDDSLLRGYTPGDDPRRIHWASSGRRGTLLVRNEENTPTAHLRVVFDSRLLADPADVGAQVAAGAVDWADRHAIRCTLTIVDGTEPGTTTHGFSDCLDALAFAHPVSGPDAAAPAFEANLVSALGRARTVVTLAVLGPVHATDALDALRRIHPARGSSAVIVTSAEAATSPDHASAALREVMVGAGWDVHPVPPLAEQPLAEPSLVDGAQDTAGQHASAQDTASAQPTASAQVAP